MDAKYLQASMKWHCRNLVTTIKQSQEHLHSAFNVYYAFIFSSSSSSRQLKHKYHARLHVNKKNFRSVYNKNHSNHNGNTFTILAYYLDIHTHNVTFERDIIVWRDRCCTEVHYFNPDFTTLFADKP